MGEYGGLGRHIENHRWYENAATTYVNYDNEQKLTDAYVENTKAVMGMAKDATANDGSKAAFCAAVYTQTTDVETEVNGLMTYDRAVVKVNESRIREINLQLTSVYNDDATQIISVPSDMHVQQSIYNLSGIRTDSLSHGINIVRMEDGTICKVYCK